MTWRSIPRRVERHILCPGIYIPHGYTSSYKSDSSPPLQQLQPPVSASNTSHLRVLIPLGTTAGGLVETLDCCCRRMGGPSPMSCDPFSVAMILYYRLYALIVSAWNYKVTLSAGSLRGGAWR